LDDYIPGIHFNVIEKSQWAAEVSQHGCHVLIVGPKDPLLQEKLKMTPPDVQRWYEDLPYEEPLEAIQTNPVAETYRPPSTEDDGIEIREEDDNGECSPSQSQFSGVKPEAGTHGPSRYPSVKIPELLLRQMQRTGFMKEIVDSQLEQITKNLAFQPATLISDDEDDHEEIKSELDS
jgi:hypothetical protein